MALAAVALKRPDVVSTLLSGVSVLQVGGRIGPPLLREPGGLPAHLLLPSRTEAPAQISIGLKSRRANADEAPGGPICPESGTNPRVFISALGAAGAAVSALVRRWVSPTPAR